MTIQSYCLHGSNDQISVNILFIHCDNLLSPRNCNI